MLVQDWAPLAACGTAEPDALFVQGAAQQQAKQICLRCPVVAECLADALDRSGATTVRATNGNSR